MGTLLDTVNTRIKHSSTNLFIYFLRLVSGMVLGLTVALIGEEIIGYGSLAFTLVLVTVTGSFLRITRNWGMASVLVFDLVCVLVGLLLRMYILVAPGA
ncbi:MAG: hypothetical protein H6626_11360 [Pseudobdellovibrionaceae bacterium]|mgnify:CR=1 FL=1|nr:hypothetical protein [Bdellovibrionales bacterium]USN46794.1 MAG: hypothetical protein H6626_11360 [Pseudobdellovibrionaceae bacterium]